MKQPLTHIAPGQTIHATSKDDVISIVKWANQNDVSIFTDKKNIDTEHGIYIDMNHWQATVDIFPDDLIAIVSPSATPSQINEAVAKHGLTYPPDANSQHTVIADHLAANESGPHQMKYGVTKDYVIGLEIVTPEGELMRTGGRTIKNVTGYDVTKLIVGAQGAFGFITEATLKLMPKPPARHTLTATFNDIEEVARAATAIFKSSVLPAKLAFQAIDEPQLLIALNGLPKTVEAEANTLNHILGESTVIADTVWDSYQEHGFSEKFTVTPAKFPSVLRTLNERGARCHGHAGNCLWHITADVSGEDAGLFSESTSETAKTLMTKMKDSWDPNHIIQTRAGARR